MPAKTMHDLLIENLRDIYHAEKQTVRALPKIAKAVTSDTLRQAIDEHVEQTRGQIDRLEQIFDLLDTRTRGKRCEAMEGLLDETREILELGLQAEVLDAALIGAAQKIEHYEIASYGTLHAYAQVCGLNKVADLLDQTLQEERLADERLNRIAIEEVNQKAVSASGQKAA
jgi:ferritin-like metal-binding protein YciE